MFAPSDQLFVITPTDDKYIEAALRMARVGYRPTAILEGGWMAAEAWAAGRATTSSTPQMLSSYERLLVRDQKDVESVAPGESTTAAQKSTLFLDVRTPDEFSNSCRKGGGHLQGAVNFPLSDFIPPGETNVTAAVYENSKLRELLEQAGAGTTYCYCKSGYRSIIATSVLRAVYGVNAVDVEGGFDRLRQNALSVVGYSESDG